MRQVVSKGKDDRTAYVCLIRVIHKGVKNEKSLEWQQTRPEIDSQMLATLSNKAWVLSKKLTTNTEATNRITLITL